MSRSIHKTVKGVFGGKSASEINSMIDEDDSDVEDLRKKKSYKKSKLLECKEERNLKGSDS